MRDCPACDNESRRRRGEKDGFQLSQCDSCHTLYVNELPTAEELAALYEVYYEDAQLSPPPFVSQRLDVVVDHLAPHRELNRWLDVGFGAGLLLQAAKRGGWDVAGTEVANPAFEQMRDEGFEVYLGEIGKCGLPAGSFDVVSMVEVLEHVDDPVKLVAEAGRLLRPGGVLYFTTPNIGSLSYRLLGKRWSVVTPPHHLQLFSKIGIEIMLGRAGFKALEVERVGVNPNEFTSVLPKRGSISANQRVESAHRLNESMLSSSWKRALRTGLNRTLSATGTGDTLKVVGRNDGRSGHPDEPDSVEPVREPG
jgi:2-polyprenyl-3-methyl-5-hydroxy-6-metoxy-1,4-benzoquinol methylase